MSLLIRRKAQVAREIQVTAPVNRSLDRAPSECCPDLQVSSARSFVMRQTQSAAAPRHETSCPTRSHLHTCASTRVIRMGHPDSASGRSHRPGEGLRPRFSAARATRPRTRPRHRAVQGPLRAKRPFDSIRTDHRSCARPAQLNRGHGGGHRGRWTTCRHTWHGGLSPRAVRPAVPRGFEAPSGAREGPSQPSRDGRWLTLERSALVSVSRCVALGIPSGGHCVLISETVPS